MPTIASISRAFGDPSHGDLGPQRTNALKGAADQGRFSELEYGGHNQALRYDGIFSPNWLLEASVARAYTNITEIPGLDAHSVTDRTVVPQHRPGRHRLLRPGPEGREPPARPEVDQHLRGRRPPSAPLRCSVGDGRLRPRLQPLRAHLYAARRPGHQHRRPDTDPGRSRLRPDLPRRPRQRGPHRVDQPEVPELLRPGHLADRQPPHLEARHPLGAPATERRPRSPGVPTASKASPGWASWPTATKRPRAPASPASSPGATTGARAWARPSTSRATASPSSTRAGAASS